jgi:SNF2 family DNA or RNA helicase
VLRAELPDKIEMKVICTLTREQATLYRAVVDEMMGGLAGREGIARRGAVLAGLAKLKSVCNHPAQFLADRSALAGRSGKLARAEEILEEALANGEKSLIFTQYAAMGALLSGYLAERFAVDVLFLHGGVRRAVREEQIAAFGRPEGPPIFVLSLKAGGTGLNLTAASQVLHYDRWWNPAVEAQATDRAFRIGQTRDVQVRTLVCAGTLEERIDALLESKRGLAEQVVSTGEDWLADLDASRIAGIVALADDAVAEE